MIKKIWILIVLLACNMHVFLHSQDNVLDEIVWIVGDEAIFRSEVENQRLFMQSQRMRFENDPYCYIPEQLAIKKLFLNQAKIDSIEVDESHIIRSAEARINYMINEHGSREKMEEYFNKKLSQLKEEQQTMMRDEAIIEKMQAQLVGEVKLTPSEVRQYFRNISPDSLPMVPTTVEVQIITLEPNISFEETDAIKARLREFTDMVHEGKIDFATLAIAYSEDEATAMRGGEMSFISKSSLVPEFANVAFNLSDPNRVSNIVETEDGFHIIQLIEKRGDRINCRHILLRPRVSDSALMEATTRMDSLYNDIVAEKLTFEEAAYYISYDKDTKNNKGLMVNQNGETSNYGTPKFEMQDLPQEIAKVVDTMGIGEMSTHFRMKTERQKDVIAIVKLKARTPNHRANLTDDYQALRTIVENQKREDLVRKWIENKQKTVYVRIAEGWRGCEFHFPGWIKE